MKLHTRGKTVLFLTILGLLLTIAPHTSAQQVDTSQRRGPMPPTLNQQPGTTTAPRPEEGYYFEEDLIPPTPTPIPLTFEQMIMQKGSAYGSVKHILAGNLFELENEYRVQLLGVKALSSEQANAGRSHSQRAVFRLCQANLYRPPASAAIRVDSRPGRLCPASLYCAARWSHPEPRS